MKLGILVLSIGSFGKSKYYNLQELGLGKSLDKYFDEVIIYKLVDKNNKYDSQKVDNTKNTIFKTIPSNKIGTNGIIDVNVLDSNLDALICFSDTQLFFPKVCKWCLKNNVKLYPYIGTIKSNSNSILKRIIIDFFARRNMKYYKKYNCFVKTNDLKKQLESIEAKKINVIPVGLNIDLLKKDYKNYDKNVIKNEYNISLNDKVLIFVGRLTLDKKPLKMIDIFNNIVKKDNNYKLIIVGQGELKEELLNKINELKLNNNIIYINKIPNDEIWKLYYISNYFINLNTNEIFGMAILEAMYYDVTIIAWNAPGPNTIIKDQITGYLVNNDEQIIDTILNNKKINAHDYILSDFTWEKSSKKIEEIIKGEQNE